MTLNTDLGSTWANFGAGVTGQLTHNTSAFVVADYNISLDDGSSYSLSGKAGFKVIW